MFAIIRSGNQQFKVQTGDKIFVQKINHGEGVEFESSEVLMLEDGGQVKIGQPFVANSKYKAKVQKHFKAEKIIVFKKKRRKNYRRKKGHRQELTEIQILSIQH